MINVKPALTTQEQMRLRYGENPPAIAINPIESNREPTLLEMAENFSKASVAAIRYAARHGIAESVVDKETFDARLGDCRHRCPKNLWAEDARLGFGKCKHTDCGCTRLKLWLVTAKCPINFWKK